MSKMIVEFTWDGDDLGPTWLNTDNLALLLYTNQLTYRELVQFEMLEHSDPNVEKAREALEEK